MRLKTKEEIEIMKEGGKRHAEILSILGSMCKPGVSSQDLEDEAARLVEEGGDKPAHLGYTPRGAERPFPAVLCVSINEEIVHGIPNEDPKVFKDGDIVSIDLSLWHKDLVTDSAITVAVGEVDKETRMLLDVAKRALSAGIKVAVPGNTVGDIGEAIHDTVEAGGFKVAEDLAGHGVGYEIHEDPLVPNTGRAGTGARLEPGLVIAIEPMITAGSSKISTPKRDGYTISTKDGSKSAHFEHTVAVTDKGNVILTQI